MRKIYFTLLVLVSGLTLQAQILLNERFESAFPPSGWTLINGNAPNGYDWTYNSDSNLYLVDQFGVEYPTYSGSGSMVYEFDPDNSAKAWAITPGLNLTAGVAYVISFHYRVFDATYPEKLKVTVGNGATVAAQTTVLWDNNGGTQLTNENWLEGAVTYTPTISGSFNFGFNCYSDPDQFALIVDNIKVEVYAPLPGCTTNASPLNNATNVSVYPLTLTWNAAPGATSYDLYLDTTNSPAFFDNLTSTSTSVTLRGANYNTTYYWYVIPRTGGGPASGCSGSVTSFTTQNVPTPPSNDDCSNAISIGRTALNSTTVGGTQSMPAQSCAGFTGNANDDVWYKYTAPRSGRVSIILTPLADLDAVVEAYTGVCGTLAKISCADAGVDGDAETLTLTGLNAGQTYYIRVYGWSGEGYEGDFTIQVNESGLPVTLTAFKGELRNGKAILTWETATEQNNRGFELQRSADGVNFTAIAFVNSKAPGGNSTSALQYYFEDENPFSGNTYYRLKQTDLDLTAVYSNVINLKSPKVNALELRNVYPNPANKVINVEIAVPASDVVNLIVTDLAGKVIMQKTVSASGGYNNYSLDVSKLTRGNYIIKAVNVVHHQTAVSKFVKQ